MSKSMNSPTARLLRSSRLLTLPRPLPPPPLDIGSQGVYSHSPSATLPYPTHQAITTFPSSLLQGDFGLKRALPAKTTRRTSTPHIRVKAHDNTEHITAFESAADHTLTEAKWRQMGVPIFLAKDPNSRKAEESGRQRTPIKISAYDERYDNTHRNKEVQAEGARWKREGPSLASMQNGEFEHYLANTLAPRKKEFETFLKERIVREKVEDLENYLLRGRAELDEDDMETIAAETENYRMEVDDNFDNELKKLRDEQGVMLFGSQLTSAVADFLDTDAPEFGPPVSEGAAFSIQVHSNVDRSRTGRRKEKEPMSTHPAAGLSFSLTDAILENHPQYGPQDRRSPVLARVLVPRGRSGGAAGKPKNTSTVVGVGGIVANEQVYTTKSDDRRRVDVAYDDIDTPERDWLDARGMSYKIDPDLVGGNKFWVHAQSATIEPNGRIHLQVIPALDDEALIKIGRGDIVAKKKNTDPSAQRHSLPPRQSDWKKLFSRGSAAASVGESIAEEHEDSAFLDSMKAAMKK